MKFNDIEQRITNLYSSIDLHFELFSKKTEPQQKEITFDDGKKGISITIGNEETTELEKGRAYSQILNIIHNLANFKDNLKKALSEKNISEKLVEIEINSSKELQIIADLSNQDKHGYPLKFTRRSKLDPIIDNVNHSWNVKLPLGKIFHNPMMDDTIVDADILDKNRVFIFKFSELIEKATITWENFILKHLPEKSQKIQIVRDQKDIIENKRKKLQHLINEAHKILEASDWIEIPSQKLQLGMVIWFDQKGKYFDSNKGIITEISIQESEHYVSILKDFPMRFVNKQKINETRWKIFLNKHPNDLAILSYYFYSFPNKYNELISLIMEKKNTLQQNL